MTQADADAFVAQLSSDDKRRLETALADIKRIRGAAGQTIQHWMASLGASQRQRLRDAAALYAELRRDVARNITDIEPRLASPRSSLNPQNFDASHGIDDGE